jgi:formylmethanofuran dehydrogenase subunit E
MCLPMEPRCTRCNKRLSRKTARLIDGNILCSACVFPPLKKGLPS